MGKVFYKMSEEVIKGMPAFNIFLSAMRAEPFFDVLPAVQAVFIFSYFSVAHGFMDMIVANINISLIQ